MLKKSKSSPITSSKIVVSNIYPIFLFTGGVKLSKLEKKEAYSTLKEEKRKNKSRDKDKENSDSHKSTENSEYNIISHQMGML